jgi:SPP1 gp7 family putative phage head morphogenesis protein
MDFLFAPAPHQEAADFIASKPVVARDVFDGLLPDLRARAFTITGLEGQANVAQAIRDRIAELPAGALWDDVKQDVAADISPFLVDPHETDPEKHDAQIAAANRRAELLLRTHGFQAYQAAQFGVMDRQRDVLPFWQYLTMEDARVRPTHAALDKIVLPADSPFWANHFPPWDFGCRCQAVPISQDERDDLAQADQKRPTDDRLVFEGPRAQHLVDGTLVRNGRTFDVRAPQQKSDTGFGWDPRTLRMPLDELEARYDKQTWAEFKAWAERTPLGAHQPTVWSWLGGKPAAGATPPPHGQPAAPAPAPRPTLDQFIAAHTAQPGQMTPAEATNLVAALKQNHGVTVQDKVASIGVPRGYSAQWKTTVSAVVQEFIDVVPKPLLDTLPAITIRVRRKLPGALGEYDPGKDVLSLNGPALSNDTAEFRRVLFHELAHWLHLRGPKAYRDAILAHFNARTAGESAATLPGYNSSTRGKKDQWFHVYMGRQYPGIVDGSEIPTKVFELLTEPFKLSTYWNIPLHRETIKAALAVLFL